MSRSKALGVMVKRYEIFKIDITGESVWVGEAEEAEEADRKAKDALAADPHSDYCVVDQRTGEIESFQLGELIRAE